MISFIIALVFSSCITVYADRPFILRDCAAKDNATILILKSASVTPDPIVIPGSVKATVVAELLRDAACAELNLVIELKKYVTFLWIPLPCISNVGSCTYYDVCDLLGNPKTCPPELVANDVPCSCATLKKGVYSLNNQKFDIPALSGALSSLATGDYNYKVDMKLVDKISGQEVACLHGEVTIADGYDCDGFLCSIFG